jgi:hypothetical protein
MEFEEFAAWQALMGFPPETPNLVTLSRATPRAISCKLGFGSAIRSRVSVMYYPPELGFSTDQLICALAATLTRLTDGAVSWERQKERSS